jgi:hypothetical protein
MPTKLAVFLCLSLIPSFAFPQTIVPISFLTKLLATIPAGTPMNGVHLEGRAQYVAGSLHETGTATLDAKSDGTATVVLSLDTASGTDSYALLSADRTCQHTTRSGAVSDISKIDCLTPLPWFAPILSIRDPLQLPALIAITDGGEVTRNSALLHDLTYGLLLHGRDTTSTNLLVQATNVHVLYDPQTLLASGIEYSIHPNGDMLTPIEVRIAFSDYRNTSGVMLPYHIERYVNRSLFLTIDVNSALLN